MSIGFRYKTLVYIRCIYQILDIRHLVLELRFHFCPRSPSCPSISQFLLTAVYSKGHFTPITASPLSLPSWKNDFLWDPVDGDRSRCVIGCEASLLCNHPQRVPTPDLRACSDKFLTLFLDASNVARPRGMPPLCVEKICGWTRASLCFGPDETLGCA